MLQYGDYHIIAQNILAKLDIPEVIDDQTAKSLSDKYLRDDTIIDTLVEDELKNYDISGNHPADIQDIKDNAADEIFFEIDDLIQDFQRSQSAITTNAYAQIVELIQNANIEGVTDVGVEYDPGDPDVGIYGESRSITISLSNGEYILFNVEFGD